MPLACCAFVAGLPNSGQLETAASLLQFPELDVCPTLVRFSIFLLDTDWNISFTRIGDPRAIALCYPLMACQTRFEVRDRVRRCLCREDGSVRHGGARKLP